MRGGTITKAEAVALIGDRYYRHADKYVGDILSRMVDAGMLTRVKPGVFTIGNGKAKVKAKPEGGDDGQSSLFGD